MGPDDHISYTIGDKKMHWIPAGPSPQTGRFYGALPSPHDPALQRLDLASLTKQTPWEPGLSVDHRDIFLPVDDQGTTPDCCIYATAAALAAVFNRVRQKQIPPSFSFTSYEVRSGERSIGQNVGTYPLHSYASLAREGLCPVHCWPNGNDWRNLDPHTWKQWFQFVRDRRKRWQNGFWLPDDPFFSAAHFRGTTHRALPDGDSNAIWLSLSNDFTPTFGVALTRSFEDTASDGMVPLPDVDHEEFIGGHCMTLVGRRADGWWIVRNSWGIGWGDRGHCYLHPTWFENPRADGKTPIGNFDIHVWHAIAAA